MRKSPLRSLSKLSPDRGVILDTINGTIKATDECIEKLNARCDSSGLKIDINNAWHADNKPITHLRRGQNDDDAVMLSQMTDITIKKVVMDNLLPQTIKQLIPHHHSADYRNQDFVNKQFVDSKASLLIHQKVST